MNTSVHKRKMIGATSCYRLVAALLAATWSCRTISSRCWPWSVAFSPTRAHMLLRRPCCTGAIYDKNSNNNCYDWPIRQQHQQHHYPKHRSIPYITRIWASPESTKEIPLSTTDNNHSSNDDIASMRVAQIRTELQTLSIDYSDCFDKESLVQRLLDARSGKVLSKRVVTKEHSNEQPPPQPQPVEMQNDKNGPEEPIVNDVCPPPPPPSQGSTTTTATTTTKGTGTTTATTMTSLEEIRKMSVKELRQELGQAGIRWNTMIEKEELVQAVVKARKAVQHFSVTGLLRPGFVTDVNADQLEMEIRGSTTTTTLAPLLVDVYAVWCGPCQLMSKQLNDAAMEWGNQVRVVKIDSDKYPQMASTFKVQGLPTLLLFPPPSTPNNIDLMSNEIGRMEGALTKDQLLQWVRSKL